MSIPYHNTNQSELANFQVNRMYIFGAKIIYNLGLCSSVQPVLPNATNSLTCYTQSIEAD